MTNATELKVARRNTRAFIDADPVKVSLSRPTTVATAAGGLAPGLPQSLPLQTIRLVPLSGNVWDRSKQKVDEGNIPDVTFQLVGMPGVDIKKGDQFTWEDEEWTITHVSPERTVRTSANIMLLSQANQE